MHDRTASSNFRPMPGDPVLWLAIALWAAIWSVLSVMRYQAYNAGMLDLGNMYQSISSVLRGQPLVVTASYGNVSRLGGHVELLYYAFVPLVALWPDPRAILIGQALLAAAGAIPAYRLARRRLGSVPAARCVALIYLLYPVAQTAILFDFHADTLAMPLLMFALDAADRRAWRPFALWATLAVFAKLYMVVPVAAIGGYLLLWGGERRAGLITGLLAGLYGLIAFFGIRELFASTALESNTGHYVNHYYGALDTVGATWIPRLFHGLVVFGPALFIAWRSWRWLLCGLPLALAVLISSSPGAGYHYGYHHYATVVPFIVMAVVDGAERARARAETAPVGTKVRRWLPDLAFTTVIVAVTCAILVEQPLSPRFWLPGVDHGLNHENYGRTARDGLKDHFLATYGPPPAAPAAISSFIAPHSANRDVLYTIRYPADSGGKQLPLILPHIEYALADALFDYRVAEERVTGGGIDYERDEIGILLREPAFGLVVAQDGLLLFQRNAPAGKRLSAEIAVVQAAGLPERADYFGPIKLVGAEITRLGERRFRASFAWTLTGPLPEGDGPIAVSQLLDVDGARMPHLPSFALLPTGQWRQGAIVRESFEVLLPPELAPGRYSWQVAWYDPTHPEAHATDARSLLPDSALVTIAEIEVD